MLEEAGNIVVVDDDEDTVELLRLLLEGEGYRVSGYTSAHAALERARAGPDPSLFLIDVMMPKMGGLELLRQVRAFNGTMTMALMTASSPRLLDPDELIALRVAHVFLKPFELDLFLDQVRIIIHEARVAPRVPGRSRVEGGRA